MQSAAVYPGLGPMMKKEFPEVENFCRLIDTRISWSGPDPVQNSIVLANDEHNMKNLENKGYYADQSVLQMFTITFVLGHAKTSLDGQDKILLSQSTARKYFVID